MHYHSVNRDQAAQKGVLAAACDVEGFDCKARCRSVVAEQRVPDRDTAYFARLALLHIMDGPP